MSVSVTPDPWGRLWSALQTILATDILPSSPYTVPSVPGGCFWKKPSSIQPYFIIWCPALYQSFQQTGPLIRIAQGIKKPGTIASTHSEAQPAL